MAEVVIIKILNNNFSKGTPGEAVCHAFPSAGSCKYTHHKARLAWYFNSTLKICQQYLFTGCEGNMNRFDTREYCEKICSMLF